MQVWNQVIAIDGDFVGEAGLVQAFDAVTGETTVQFDLEERPVVVHETELEIL